MADYADLTLRIIIMTIDKHIHKPNNINNTYPLYCYTKQTRPLLFILFIILIKTTTRVWTAYRSNIINYNTYVYNQV